MPEITYEVRIEHKAPACFITIPFDLKPIFGKKYSRKPLGRIWGTEGFSSWMTWLLHWFPEDGISVNG
jgi:hypothetical protein